jgi:small-conductance mechanosensitive channel
MSITIRDVNSSIMFGDFTNEQLGSIIDAIKYRRAQLTQETKRAITNGSKVQFYSAKRGMTVTGTVEKIAIKYITVNTSTGRWRVPASMLTAV